MFLSKSRRLRAASIGVLLALTGPCFAWVYPEHRDITVLGVEVLDPQRAAAFHDVWKEARIGHENRLCEQPVVADQGTAPLCLDWAALPAIAGDHSCSSKDMLDIVLRSDWILNVADVAAQLKEDLSRVPVVPAPGQQADSEGVVRYPVFARRIQGEKIRSERLNALRTSDIRLQRADPAYATHAGANNAHFLLARPTTHTSIANYADITIGPGAELNAVGVYSYFHLSALQKANCLANEAFALHFLQDTFAAGHVSGTWGSTSQRKGTHDFCNANGLEALTWDHQGGTLVIMGDAHLRPDDAKVAAMAVRASLDQLVDAAAGKPVPGVRHSTTVASHDVPAVNSHDKKWRKPLLEAGVSLYEIRHDAAVQRELADTAPVRSEFMGLHVKAVAVDGERVMIGSMNLDPRSAAINSEMAVIVESQGLAADVVALIRRGMQPVNSWRVELDAEGALRWVNREKTVTQQPARNAWQRVEDIIFMAFPREYY